MPRPMFSTITASLSGPPNALAQALARLAAAGRPVVDLINGNPTQHGLVYPAAALEDALLQALPQSTVYRPDPRGDRAARAAIAGYYAAQGLPCDAQQIILTPGTSQSYWYLFQLLADPGQEILVPQPSYPLFAHIAALCRLTLRPYPLVRVAGTAGQTASWAIDLEALAAAITPQARAIVLISPHNPTGHVASAAEVAGLTALAARHRIPLIADEVFCEFLLDNGSFTRAAAADAPLVFTLNGFSKMLALPGWKVGWLLASGEQRLVSRALAALETITDTFLATQELSQRAVPALLAAGADFLETYRQAVRTRAALAHRYLADSPRITVNRAQGGFYLTMDVAALAADDEHVALDLLLETGILTHPGWFYDIETPHLVLSFLAEERVLQAELPRLRAFLEAY